MAKKKRKHETVRLPEPAMDRPVSPKSILTGPWGELEIGASYLEAPDSFLKLLALPSQHTVWNFTDLTRAEVVSLLADTGLEKAKFDALTAPSVLKEYGRSCRIFPDVQTLLALSPQERSTIYRILAGWEENPIHKYPVVLENTDPDDFLLGLPTDAAGVIARLAYQEGDIHLFSDLPVLLGKLTGPVAERALLRVLSRVRALHAGLRISPDDDIEKLCAYWSVNGRNTDPVPLLKSHMISGGNHTLDITHLMPATVRGRLYTYPSVYDVMQTGRAPDGFWTAVNFFNRIPVPLYQYSPNPLDYLKRTFQQVSEPWTFGDMLLIGDPDNLETCHACTVIAGNIVYTKESSGFFSPWVLSDLNRVIQYHTRGCEKREVVGLRRVR